MVRSIWRSSTGAPATVMKATITPALGLFGGMMTSCPCMVCSRSSASKATCATVLTRSAPSPSDGGTFRQDRGTTPRRRRIPRGRLGERARVGASGVVRDGEREQCVHGADPDGPRRHQPARFRPVRRDALSLKEPFRIVLCGATHNGRRFHGVVLSRVCRARSRRGGRSRADSPPA
jgi:hypothetical protein